MSTALAHPSDVQVAPEGFVRAADGRLTLDEMIVDVWEGLFVRGMAPCPVCPGSLTWSDGKGRCSGCGSSLD